ncbi:unnamed protein product [Somion occarium]|uniref:Nudix hydrolase domain-containing protein n=1 Tax=Somion occarium TaxID=3059160 RepID=A0ABP1CNV4_9APHY
MACSSSSSPEMSAPRSRSHTEHFSLQDKLHEVLEDLSSRFILNLPDEELASLERVCFQVEQAHWYYEDFIREQDDRLPTMSLKKFSNSLFHVCPLLSHWGDDHEQTFQNFMAYKTRVPVCGAIMLNETWDKCLLVKGWKSTSAWSFPKGKINEQEPRHRCAVREVLEETGFDLGECINPEDAVEVSIREQTIALYIVPNVPESYPFETRTRKEISKISWFKLTDLPTWKRNKAVPGKFYLITPFIGPLRAFIRDRKPRNLHRRTIKHPVPCAEPEVHLSSDEDARGTTDVQSSHINDHGAQESSSQASSADNGEPQTPSPLYSEPPVSTYKPEADVQQDIDLQNVDPNLARLLTSLSISASVTPMEGDVSKVISDSAQAVPLPPSTPLSHSGTLRTSHSSRTPSVVPRSVQPSPSPSLRTASRQAHAVPPPNIPLGSEHSTSRNEPVIPTSPTSPTSRRAGGMSVETSPYFSRPAIASTIPKQMKYHAMLEHVAKESQRMTPKLERQGFVPPSPGSIFPAGPPVQSASIPSHATTFGNPSALYTSNPSGRPPPHHNIPSSASTLQFADPLTSCKHE